MNSIQWGPSIPHSGGSETPCVAEKSRCLVECQDGNTYGSLVPLYGHEFSWFSVVSFKLPKDHPYYNETKKTEQVYVCSLNDDILVGTTEQLMELMVEREWTLAEFLEMTTYKLGEEVKLKLTIE